MEIITKLTCCGRGQRAPRQAPRCEGAKCTHVCIRPRRHWRLFRPAFQAAVSGDFPGARPQRELPPGGGSSRLGQIDDALPFGLVNHRPDDVRHEVGHFAPRELWLHAHGLCQRELVLVVETANPGSPRGILLLEVGSALGRHQSGLDLRQQGWGE